MVCCCRNAAEALQQKIEATDAKRQRSTDALLERKAALEAEASPLLAGIALWRRVLSYITAPNTSGTNKDPGMSWKDFFLKAFEEDEDKVQKAQDLDCPESFEDAETPFLDVNINVSRHLQKLQNQRDVNLATREKLTSVVGSRQKRQEVLQEKAEKKAQLLEDPGHHEALKNLVQTCCI